MYRFRLRAEWISFIFALMPEPPSTTRSKRLENSGRVAGNYRVCRHIFGDHTAGANHRVIPNGYATQQRRTGSDGGALFDQGWDANPIRVRLQLTFAVGGTRITVICKGNIVSDKYLVFQSHAFANKSVTRNFATIPDFDAFLNFDKCADFYVVSNFTTIQIDKPMEPNVSTQLDVWSNPLERLL